MTRAIPIPEAQLNDCRELLSRYFSEESRDQFEEALDCQDYDIMVEMLKQALNTKDDRGLPCGKLGTPMERYAAQSIIKRLETSGYGGPGAG